MAQLATIHSPVVLGGSRLRRSVALAVLAAICVAAVVLTLALSGGSNSSTVGESARSHAVAPSTRFDGGPDEGTRGGVVSPSGSRFDGGPDEGTRGIR